MPSDFLTVAYRGGRWPLPKNFILKNHSQKNFTNFRIFFGENLKLKTRRKRKVVLDLFCGQGGAALGYRQAGFDVVGVDILPQPRYPFSFIQTDITKGIQKIVREVKPDLIHASPPCQAYSKACQGLVLKPHLKLIPEVRRRLQKTKLPYIIENVYGAPLQKTQHEVLLLCGSMFFKPLQRHRYFETTLHVPQPQCNHMIFEMMPRRFWYQNTRGPQIGPTGKAGHWSRILTVYGSSTGSTKADRVEVMEMPWATMRGMAEAIPPYFTHYIGSYVKGKL
jgi:DNA (cytosine-5)-methyltransferase 1